MKALTTSIFSKATGSAFSTAVGGRFYKGRAPAGAVYPYAVFMVVSDCWSAKISSPWTKGMPELIRT